MGDILSKSEINGEKKETNKTKPVEKGGNWLFSFLCYLYLAVKSYRIKGNILCKWRVSPIYA